MIKDDDFKLLRGFDNRQTNICKCRVAFVTENSGARILTVGWYLLGPVDWEHSSL